VVVALVRGGRAVFFTFQCRSHIALAALCFSALGLA
jgi:hypothetical protein